MFFKIIITALCAVLVLFLVAAAALVALALAAAGLLSVFAALGSITGILRNIASDLSPPAMLFTGLFGVFSALSLTFALYILCPKAVRHFNLTMDKIFS
jgi:hypothetical protein